MCSPSLLYGSQSRAHNSPSNADDPSYACSSGLIYQHFANTITSPVLDFGCLAIGMAAPVTYYRSLGDGAPSKSSLNLALITPLEQF